MSFNGKNFAPIPFLLLLVSAPSYRPFDKSMGEISHAKKSFSRFIPRVFLKLFSSLLKAARERCECEKLDLVRGGHAWVQKKVSHLS
jgi:hypothetical protein